MLGARMLSEYWDDPNSAPLPTCLRCNGNSPLGVRVRLRCEVQAASDDLVMPFQVVKRSAISVR